MSNKYLEKIAREWWEDEPEGEVHNHYHYDPRSEFEKAHDEYRSIIHNDLTNYIYGGISHKDLQKSLASVNKFYHQGKGLELAINETSPEFETTVKEHRAAYDAEKPVASRQGAWVGGVTGLALGGLTGAVMGGPAGAKGMALGAGIGGLLGGGLGAAIGSTAEPSTNKYVNRILEDLEGD